METSCACEAITVEKDSNKKKIYSVFILRKMIIIFIKFISTFRLEALMLECTFTSWEGPPLWSLWIPKGTNIFNKIMYLFTEQESSRKNRNIQVKLLSWRSDHSWSQPCETPVGWQWKHHKKDYLPINLGQWWKALMSARSVWTL